MRELLYTALVNSPVVPAFLVGDQILPTRVRVYQWGSLGIGAESDPRRIPEIPTMPFCVIFENPSTVNQEVQETHRSQNRYFQVYCYDEHGLGYLRIEQVLRWVRDTVLGLPMQVSPSGAQCTDARWLGMSSDSRDPGYNANMKFILIKFTASQ